MSTKRQRAAAVIVRDGFLLVVKRVRSHKRYFVLPGGGVEDGETIEEACVREVLEETGLTAAIRKTLCELENERQREHYFLVTVVSGVPIIGWPEVNRQSSESQSHLEWIQQLDLLQPAEMRQVCVDCLTLM
ncbi:MAG: NUDIX domain-containing protein [Anaerolineae bacterium]